MNGESLWPRLAGLPLVIEACEYERLHAVLAYEFERITTHVRLVGAGADGLGEDDVGVLDIVPLKQRERAGGDDRRIDKQRHQRRGGLLPVAAHWRLPSKPSRLAIRPRIQAES